MIRLLSSVALAGAMALSMSAAAEARHGGPHGKHYIVKKHAPVCHNVTQCIVKKKFFKTKRVCTTRRVCSTGHGHGHHR
jgi:hypothetical protein